MLSQEDNELLTKVGRGTPGGELLRRYWMPICPAADITEATPKKRIRMLGEDLVVFRDGSGRLGLIAEHCPHRRASLYFGFVEADGLRCPYHGWKFAASGECLEQPFERSDALKQAACQTAYPVQQLAGILFGYLGPLPAPLLPRWETLVRRDGTREIEVLPLHDCNWLQAQENSHDPVHTFYLHAHMLKTHAPERYTRSVAYFARPIENYEFELCREPSWTGIRKSRTYGGDRPEAEVGHPAIFPNMLIAPQGGPLVTHWRIPVDDEHTNIIWLSFTPTDDGSLVDQPEEAIPVTRLAHPRGPDGEYDLTSFQGQDLMAWETQGRLFDRSSELLGASDRGIVMFRALLKQQIERVQAGLDPAGVIRDPALNDMISFTVSPGQALLAREMEPAS